MEERRHPPTSRSLERLREEGVQPIAGLLTTGVSLLVLAALASALARPLLTRGVGALSAALAAGPTPVEGGALAAAGTRALAAALGASAALALAIGGAGWLGHLLQTRFLWASPGLRAPRPAAVQVGWGPLSVGRAALVGAVCVATWAGSRPFATAQGLAHLPPDRLAVGAAAAGVALLARLAAAVFAVGLIDYALRWWHFWRSAHLTTPQLREELRETERSPVLAARLRRRRRDIGRRR